MANVRGFLLLSAGLLLALGLKAPSERAAAKERKAPKTNAARTDRYGDPLPRGAIARLGTVRFRHGSGLFAIAFAPDGKTVASAGSEGIIRLWEAATGRPRALLRHGVGTTLYTLAFSPDSKTLAAAGHDSNGRLEGPSKVILWDLAKGKERYSFVVDGGTYGIHCVAFSPDGKLLAAASSSGNIHLRRAATGKVIRRLPAQGTNFMRIAFSPDSKTLAVGGDGLVGLWQVPAGKERFSLDHEGTEHIRVAFSPDGRRLACGGFGKKICLWDPATGKLVRTFVGHEGGGPRNLSPGVGSLAYSPDSKLLATTGADGAICLWDAARCKKRLQLEGTGAADGRGWSLAFSPDGKKLAGGSTGGEIALWTVATGKRIPVTTAPPMCACRAAVSPDGRTLATAAGQSAVQLWNARTREEKGTLGNHRDGARFAAFSPDGTLLATNSPDDTVCLWNVATGKEAGQFSGALRAALSPDGKLLATVNFGLTIQVWEIATEKKLWETQGWAGNPDSLTFSADGKLLAWAAARYIEPGLPKVRRRGADGPCVYFWEAATGKEVRRLSSAAPYWNVAFAPDGRTVAMAGAGPIELWDVASGELLGQLDRTATVHPRSGRINHVRAMAFSPDSRALAAESSDHAIRLWELASGQEYLRLPGHSTRLLSLAFAPDGKTLISGSEDTTALIWDLAPPDGVPPRKGKLGRKDQDVLWASLASTRAASAYRAMGTLIAVPEEGAIMLGQRLRPASPVDAKRVRRLLAQLDDDDFTVRESASRQLKQLGAAIEPALQRALAAKPSPEVASRLKSLVKSLRRRTGLAPDALRQLRGVQILEQIGSAEARRVLKGLAAGPAEAALTQDAKAALKRLGRRTPAKQ
jgi:WD40 repeat protein